MERPGDTGCVRDVDQLNVFERSDQFVWLVRVGEPLAVNSTQVHASREVSGRPFIQ